MHEHCLCHYLVITGSYGGRGGNPASSFLTSTDSVAYGNFEEPTDPGSPGGGIGAGLGGGAVLINATSSVIVDGILSANGGDATSNAGGGSGGAIYVNANIIKGYGSISVRGGNGKSDGGGGSGGRVSLLHSDVTFTYLGDVIADGGLGGSY